MNFNFYGKRISGILSILPEKEYTFEEEAAEPDNVKNRRLKKIIGYGKRRRVKKDTVMSDMFLYGLNHLLSTNKLKKSDIGAIIVVTLSPDYWLPQISSILHGELKLSHDVFCMDIPSACAGFVVGLIQSFMLLEHMKDKKIILCTGEIFNRKTNEKEEKFTQPSFGGDIANITIVQNTDEKEQIVCNMFNDGENRNALLIHDGCFKNPMTPEKIEIQRAAIPHMMVDMDGSKVFNFVQKEVPPSIRDVVGRAGYSLEQIDYFLFHQPNKFMLQKLAEQLGVPYNKMPMELTSQLGNSDAGTIPAVATTYVSEDLLQKNNLCCLSGFGGGLTWASIVMNIGNLDFCENIISNL